MRWGNRALCRWFMGKSATGKRTIISFEAKPRHLGSGVNYHTGQPEPQSTSTFAQEVAELLGQAFSCSKRADGSWSDHDGWLISIHGSRLRIINAFFSQSYLSQVSSPVLCPDQRLLVWRSRQFNLKHSDGRDGALQLVIGLLRFLKSGRAVNSYLSRRVRPFSALCASPALLFTVFLRLLL